jgi:hypothetical protein
MKKNVLLGIVVAVLGLAAVVWFVQPTLNQPPEIKIPVKPDITPQETERLAEEGPADVLNAFPSGFPAELDRVSNSYKYIAPHSEELQATLAYTSGKSLADNKRIFADYLAAGGFTIVNSRDEQGLAFFYATRDNDDLSILIQENQNGEVSVSASFLAR